MAHFIGGVRGSRGEATRLGTAKSGVTAYAQGWHIGGTVWIRETEDGDKVSLVLHGGSSSSQHTIRCFTFYLKDGEIVQWEKSGS